MIRAFQKRDLEPVMEIWLSANLQAHPFVPRSYWESHFAEVKTMLPQAELYVAEEDGVVRGFIGLDGGYIAGLFVAEAWRSRGIGRQLLKKAKSLYLALALHVYEENEPAVRFYRREGFLQEETRVDPETNCREIRMRWEKAGCR
ncbi:GNAT family N-acetyltransferase [Clostridium sp. D33t1_170424_F3]|uniref:GNAT family N-acetyltransferase n=1 Tax=Clostridium sp. D33t1_170424_F3 TaxID=2787099 RepID=UPI0018AA8960|nr:GNAT family N-acetyltransferase [Clostridium sp. D33t1_170424_F3]